MVREKKGLKKGQWRTARGKLLRISRMSDYHLEATRKWLARTLANLHVNMRCFLEGLDEPMFGDDPDTGGIELDFLVFLFQESWLKNKLMEFEAEIKRRKSFLYRTTHRKRPEPRARVIGRELSVRF